MYQLVKEAQVTRNPRQKRAWLLAALGLLAILAIGLITQPEYVYPALARPIERKVYDQRVAMFATQLDDIQVQETLPAIYSQQWIDVQRYTAGEPRNLKGYNEDYLKLFEGVGAVMSITVTAGGEGGSIHVDDGTPREFPYIFLLNSVKEVIPVYRIPQSPGREIDERNLEVRQKLALGEYTLILVDMPNEQETKIANAQSVKAYSLSLVADLTPVNPGNSHAWIFSLDLTIKTRMNPYYTGHKVYASPELAKGSLGIQPGEEATVISVTYHTVRVSFTNRDIRLTIPFDWRKFQSAPVR